MLIHIHSGNLAYEIEAKGAEYGLDMRECVTHDGSRAYQRRGLTPAGTLEEYRDILAVNPKIWTLCSSSQ